QVAINETGNPLTTELVNLINPVAARQMLMIGITTTSFLFPFFWMLPGMSVTLIDKKEKIDTYRKWLSDVVNGNEQTQVTNREVPSAPFVLHRVSFLPGDPLISTLPYGYDFAILSSVVQQHFFHQNVELLRKIFHALLPGGRVVVREVLCAPESNSHYSNAVYSVNSLVETRGKPPYNFEEVKTALEQAGFIGVRLLNPETWMDGVIEAYKPLSAQL
ncbi:MAG: methyltransferase, partial [bacterium]|nr:methyltransferase [bacterium]